MKVEIRLYNGHEDVNDLTWHSDVSSMLDEIDILQTIQIVGDVWTEEMLQDFIESADNGGSTQIFRKGGRMQGGFDMIHVNLQHFKELKRSVMTVIMNDENWFFVIEEFDY